MKEDVAKIWCEALRSGTYQQTDGYLKTSQGFCCLGVLSDLAANRSIGKWGRDFGGSGEGFNPGVFCDSLDLDSSSSSLTRGVRDWSGIRTRDVEITPSARGDLKKADGSEPRYFLSLVQANDEGATFSEIADFVEKNWSEL